jgi:hypothetical protein
VTRYTTDELASAFAPEQPLLIPKPVKQPKPKRPIPRRSAPIPRKARLPKGSKPLKRTGPPRKRSPKRSSVEQRDSVWREKVGDRVGNRCELGYCGGDWGCDSHHVRGKKAHPHLRHVVANGVRVCRSCHDWAHANPVEFRAWFAIYRPADWRAITEAK